MLIWEESANSEATLEFLIEKENNFLISDPYILYKFIKNITYFLLNKQRLLTRSTEGTDGIL